MFDKGFRSDTVNDGAKNALALLKDVKVVENFYLAGGTGLSLQIGHRISYDLDFFTQDPLKSSVLLSSINKILKLHDVTLTDCSLRGFTDDCEISFFLYQYPLLDEKKIYNNIYLASIKDIALMKIIAIGSRGVKKYFYDLYFILKNYYSITDLFDAFQKKFEENNFNQFHYIKSLTSFEFADNDDTPINLMSDISWVKVKDFLIQQSKLL